jgi:hypothetical protein
MYVHLAPGSSCSPNEFICNDGSCVGLSDRCNGRIECQDGSDEDFCPVPGFFFLLSIKKLPSLTDVMILKIFSPKNLAKMGIFDPKQSKIMQKLYHNIDPRSSGAACDGKRQFSCDGDRCISGDLRCDGVPDCVDRTDEQDCQGGRRFCTKYFAEIVIKGGFVN